jgi:hypothetical protein
MFEQTKQEQEQNLRSMLPVGASGVHVAINGVRATVYFSMPKGWLPPEGSGIFAAREHRRVPGFHRFQIRA